MARSDYVYLVTSELDTLYAGTTQHELAAWLYRSYPRALTFTELGMQGRRLRDGKGVLDAQPLDLEETRRQGKRMAEASKLRHPANWPSA